MRSTDICWMTQCKMRSQKRVLVEGWKKAACPDMDSCHSSSSEELRAIFAPIGSESPGGILMGWGRPLRRPEGRARLFLPHSNLPRPSLDLNTSGAPITSGPYSHAGPWDHSPPPGPLLHSQGVGTVNRLRRRAVPLRPRARPRSTTLRPPRPRPAPPLRSPHSSSGRARQSPRTHSSASGDGAGPRRAHAHPFPAPGSGPAWVSPGQ